MSNQPLKESELPTVNRNREFEYFTNALQDLSLGNPTRHILNYFGVSGIGKSRLVKKCIKEVTAANWQRDRWKYAELDFEALEKQESEVQLINCLKALANSLRTNGLTEVTIPHSQSISNENEIEYARELTNDLLKYFSRGNRLVIFFDGLSQTEAWFSQFEQYFLSPLVNKAFLLVITTRPAARIDRFEVRLELRAVQLMAFEVVELYYQALTGYFKYKKTAEEGCYQTQLRQVADKLFELSCGLPGGLELLLQLVGSSELVEVWQILQKDEDLLKIWLMNCCFEKYIFGGLTAISQNDVKKLEEVFKQMAVYRRFDLSILQQATNTAYISRLAQNMTRTYAVKWETAKNGYAIDETYRCILVQGVTASTGEAEYQYLQLNALKQYIALLLENRGSYKIISFYTIELLYHMIAAGPQFKPFVVDVWKKLEAPDNKTTRNLKWSKGEDEPARKKQEALKKNTSKINEVKFLNDFLKKWIPPPFHTLVEMLDEEQNKELKKNLLEVLTHSQQKNFHAMEEALGKR